MKKLIFACAILVAFASCKKSSSSTNPTPTPTPTKGSYVSMKVNGVLVELSYLPLWPYSSGIAGAGNQVYGFGITEDVTTNARRSFLINIHQDDLKTSTATKIGVGYKSSIIYLTSQNNIKAQFKASNNLSKSNATFTLTKIKDIDATNKSFYGTFSGTLVNVDGDSIIITEGKIIE